MKRVVLFTLVLFLSQPLFAESYTIDQFIALVRTNSNDLKLARKEREKSAAVTNEAWAVALPKIQGSAEYKRNLSDFYIYTETPMGTVKTDYNKDNEYSANIAIIQPLFSAKARAALTAADQYETLSDFVYQASEEAIVIAAKKAFYQGLLLKNVWEVSRISEEQSRENYLNMKRRFNGGVASEFDMLQAEISWKNQTPKVTENQRNYRLLLANLKTLAGIASAEELELSGDFSTYPAFPETIDLETVLDNRSDFQAILMEEKMRETNISVQKADHWPTLDASLVYAYSAASDKTNPEHANTVGIAGLKLTIPIYSGGYTSAQVQKARIEHAKAGIKIEKTKREIETELSNIYLRLTEAEQRIRSGQATRKTAEKAYAIGKAQAENGLISQLQLKDARIFLEQSHLAYFSAVFDYLSAYLDWEKAVGQGV